MATDNEHNPMIKWVNALIQGGGAKYQNNDIHLTPLAARRFGLSLHEKNPVLCWSETDNDALGSIRWRSAAFVYGLENQDWIALNCPDIRVKNSGALNPVKLRLFIPITTGRLDAWKNVPPSKLGIAVFKNEKGKLAMTSIPTSFIPMKLMG